MKKIISFLALGFVMAIQGCGDQTMTKEVDVPRVKVLELSTRVESTADGRMFFPAVAVAADRSRLSFRVAGEIIKLNVSDGDRVKKGQVLAEIDPNDFQLQVDNTKASYTVADSQYRRSEPLVKKGLLAQSQFDELAAQRMIAKAEYDLAKLRLSFTQLKAPRDGIVSRVTVEQFESVQKGQQIVNIHNPEAVDVIIQVSDQLFANAPSGEELRKIQADIKIPNGQLYSAVLKEYTTEQNPETATYTATLTMPMPKDEFILDGTAVEVATSSHIAALNSTAKTIPIEAVFNPDGSALDKDNKYVWVVKSDDTVVKTKIKTSKMNHKEIQVLDGLANDATIVVAGIARLRDGMKVVPFTQESGQ